jgi:hypothetical protein
VLLVFFLSPIQIPVWSDSVLNIFHFRQAIWPHSGHYRPTEENFQEFQSFLRDNSVDLTDVKVSTC